MRGLSLSYIYVTTIQYFSSVRETEGKVGCELIYYVTVFMVYVQNLSAYLQALEYSE